MCRLPWPWQFCSLNILSSFVFYPLAPIDFKTWQIPCETTVPCAYCDGVVWLQDTPLWFPGQSPSTQQFHKYQQMSSSKSQWCVWDPSSFQSVLLALNGYPNTDAVLSSIDVSAGTNPYLSSYSVQTRCYVGVDS